ncbi:MAG: hypothetical protein EOO75_15605, partial [Myxococcales bacterium]
VLGHQPVRVGPRDDHHAARLLEGQIARDGRAREQVRVEQTDQAPAVALVERGQADREPAGTPIPCDLSFDQPGGVVVITGPNSGGKTRLLQSVALAQMFAQAGTFVPAREARVRWAEGLFVSLIEEARHDQREGRLGSELQRIREVFEQLRAGGLVLLDELCSGTNPSEGQEIFELVVDLLSELSPQAFISTHFLDFAARLAASPRPGMSFLQVELDERDEPTFQFTPGVARTSLAHKTAARLGVTRESLQALVERARRRG